MMLPTSSIFQVITDGNFSLHSKYWPLFLLFFYILAPIPYCISRRIVDDTDSASNACKELALFLTTGIVVSAFGLPIIFARADVVSIHLGDFTCVGYGVFDNTLSSYLCSNNIALALLLQVIAF
jgi:hypothetical protein